MFRIDMAGKAFGRLTVVRLFGEKPVGKEYFWECVCSCGVKTTVCGSLLRKGQTKSCGCIRRESTSATGKLNKTHGKKRTPEYAAWRAMKRRCLVSTDRAFKNYGTRGIKICDRWIDSFENFLTDMGQRPNGKTLERIENSGNYEPGNCEWASWKKQQRNKRNNLNLTLNGKTQCLSAWAEEYGIDQDVLRSRCARNGGDLEKAFSNVKNWRIFQGSATPRS